MPVVMFDIVGLTYTFCSQYHTRSAVHRAILTNVCRFCNIQWIHITFASIHFIFPSIWEGILDSKFSDYRAMFSRRWAW
jgi:hypothetical protein